METSINWVNKKRFYLELDERNDKDCLATQLVKLGGHVVTFLSKTVDFIVRKRNKNKSNCLRNNDIVKHQSRALAMIKKSKGKTVAGSSLMTETAKRWGIKILEYEETLQMVKHILRHMEMSVDKSTNVNTTNRYHKSLRELKHPFIKVEDLSGLYKPCLREFDKFPSINFESKLGTCPFDDPVEFKRKETSGNVVRKAKKARFCECCNASYTDLEKHLASTQHREFASNNSNYARIDQFIMENGLDLQTFKAKIYKKHNIT